MTKKLSGFARFWIRSAAFCIFERTLPKRPNIWCFCTWPGRYAHTLDNPRAVFEEVKNDPGIKKVILLKPQQDPNSSIVEGLNVVAVNVESLRGAYYLAQCGFLIIGYGVAGVCGYAKLIGRRHKIVQLWHGIPLKRIGKLFPGEKHWKEETPKYAASVCSSERDREIMAAAFSPLEPARIWQTGLPRNRTFLIDEADLPQDYRNDLDRLRGELAGRRLVLYAPTWRDSEIGIYPFSENHRAALRDVLVRHNAILAIRAHANRRVVDAYQDMRANGSVIFVNEYPDVNVLLRITDVLVTDYSSIFIDFMLTGRPILHFTYDIHEYVKERGFLYSLDEALPSKWFDTAEQLVQELESALTGAIRDSSRYAAARKLFHSHGTTEAADVVREIKGLAGM